MNILLSLLAVLPCAGILWWLFRSDNHPEPPRVVGITVLLGALATIPILVAEHTLLGITGATMPPHTLFDVLVVSFVIAAVTEETFKFLVLTGYCARHDEFNEPFDGVVYGAAASLGFAVIENLSYVLSQETTQDGFGVAAIRTLTAVPLHALCGGLMGSCIGIGHFAHGRSLGWRVLGLMGAVALHGVYDMFVFGAQFAGTQQSGAGVLLCIGGVGSTILLAAVAGVLGLARMRRDQVRTLDAARHPQEWPDSARQLMGPLQGLALPITESPIPPLESLGDESATLWYRKHPAASPPIRPMTALILAGSSALLCVIAFVVSIGQETVTEPDWEPPTLAILVGLGILLAALLALAAAIVATIALTQRDRWTLASVTSLVTGGLLLALLLLLFAAA
jgi:RsiW-degrading membrane proteinase PrsW (M82 family)